MFFEAGCAVCRRADGPICADCAPALVPGRWLSVEGLDRCRSAFALDDTSRPLIAAFKYRQRRRLAWWLADAMAPLVPRGADALVWIPATPEKRRLRGYDQAHELARALSARTGVPAIGLLGRRSGDHRQTGRSREARLVGPNLVPRRACPPFVVLVDDVITTGSTLRVGAGVLRGSGASRVVAVVAAATPMIRERRLPPAANTSRIPTWK